ncbi:adhesion G-protein coupled receptor G4 [Spinachia spinachia]
MTSVTGLPGLTLICLCTQLLGSRAASSASTSLWGKKLPFRARPCMWQLRRGAVLPELEELSACMLLNRSHGTGWTGFDCKPPGGGLTVLGLEGTGTQLSVWLFGEKHNLARGLKLNEWHTVCLTWSGRARRLRVYVNGTSEYAASVGPQLPRRLALNGTLTLGQSHFLNNQGEVQPESGTDLLGEIGLFRMWAREWSGEELSGRSCADGDVVRWDLSQWIHSCPPEPDHRLQCAWSLYRVNVWTFKVNSTQPGNCSLSLEAVTRNWLESIFPPSISVRNILVSSPSRNCGVVDNSTALPAQQYEESRGLSNSDCDKCFSCEFYVKVDPAANVDVVQASMASLLGSTFSHGLTADPHSISVLPVEFLPAGTEPPPTVSSGAQTLETSPAANPTNMSSPVRPDTFFRVNLTLHVYGSPTNLKNTIKKWVKKELEVNGTMIVLNLIIKENVGRYYCTFHVQEYGQNSLAEIEALIAAALTSGCEIDSIVIQTTDVAVKHIVPANCLEETTSTFYGTYIWPEAFPQVNQEMGCREPKSERAFRLCALDIETDTSSWAKPDMKQCKPLVIISDLKNITVTTGNAAEVVDVIRDLVDAQLGESAELTSSQLDTVVAKLGEVVDISSITPAAGAGIVNIVADILVSKTHVAPLAGILLNLTDRMGNDMDFPDESISITAPSMALSMFNVGQKEFSGLTYGVSFVSPDLNPEVFFNHDVVDERLPGTNATICLPSELKDFLPSGERNTTRVQFQFYGTDDLFQDPEVTNSSSWTLNSFVVSASINHSRISNLKEPVVVCLSHRTIKQPEDRVQCMFWDFLKNGGRGGWNGAGCETRSISAYESSCLCDHLTHFAVLLDVSRTHIGAAQGLILTVISYLGCGISSIFLGITLLTHLAFEKLRRDYPSKILINLSAALLGLSMLFLLDSWLSSFSNYGLCIATAAALHYFLLASFTWMALEAVHMYLALVKVFNIYIPSYIVKLCALGWGIPLVIVSLVLAVDKDAYGSIAPQESAETLPSAEQFCWLQDDIFFYVTVVAFLLLILLCNSSVFVVVMIQIRQMRANKQSTSSLSSLHDLRAVVSLTVLLGLTWSIGFFSFGPGKVFMMYLFSIFNSLQGFFVFLFHCVMKENVRKQWRIFLCCGRFRLSEYSNWSRSATAGCKKDRPVHTDSGASDNTSSVRKVSDSSSGSTPEHHQGA